MIEGTLKTGDLIYSYTSLDDFALDQDINERITTMVAVNERLAVIVVAADHYRDESCPPTYYFTVRDEYFRTKREAIEFGIAESRRRADSLLRGAEAAEHVLKSMP